jgi:hypothetical protein
MNSITLNLQPMVTLNDQQWRQLCEDYRDYRFERSPTGNGLSWSQPAVKQVTTTLSWRIHHFALILGRSCALPVLNTHVSKFTVETNP